MTSTEEVETPDTPAATPTPAGPVGGTADVDMDAEITPAPDSPEGQAAAQAEAEETDEAILGKYQSLEDLQKAYVELYRKQRNGEEPEAEGGEKPDGDKPGSLEIGDPEPEPEAPAHLERFQAAADEFAEKGELTAETRAELEKIIPGQYIDSFLQGQQLVAQNWESQIVEAAGGAEAYTEMVESQWAKNLPQEQKDAFNAAIKGKDLNAARLAVKGLYADFKAAGGRSSDHPVEGRTRGTGVKPFASHDEFLQAMDHPDYQKGGEYYQQVQRRLAATPRGNL